MFEIKKIIKERYGVILLFAIFIFSFALNLYVLTRYSLSYGIDGAFYNNQIASILQTGFPITADPPLAYYLLTPFALAGGQLLGLKIGTAFFGAVLAFPAFYLTELYFKNKNEVSKSSKAPALLSAFLITVNVNYFSMVGSYGILQNLVGVFFLVLMLYFAIKWMENSPKNKKFGVITIILLACNMLTHIYTGALAVILFFGLIIFTIFFKKLKTGKTPFFEVKIFVLVGVLVAGTFATLFAFYPIMVSKFTTFLSFFGFFSGAELNNMGSNNLDACYNYFCSLPFFLGIFSGVMIKTGS
ncbi:hypothetical protein [Methanobacterium alcaliphilum]|uniref:hypothetical protein n=1 Tax=Methanobacterium alcaliphilum TaxID=392018 RepID=UPI00200B2CC6|nr:hypothetical protein [Methanobacterium alcaliphilum]MCK9150715.1 hypothetical protein [Methanobacterium alcaliphilum]